MASESGFREWLSSLALLASLHGFSKWLHSIASVASPNEFTKQRYSGFCLVALGRSGTERRYKVGSLRAPERL